MISISTTGHPSGPYSVYELVGLGSGGGMLIDDILATNWPCVIAGPKCGLKTDVSVAAASALASGTPFLRRSAIRDPQRVLMANGPGGTETYREALKRISGDRGAHPGESANLHFSVDLPRLSDAGGFTALETRLRDKGIQILFIDPAFLGTPGRSAASQMDFERLLQELGSMCRELSVTPVVVQHTRDNRDRYALPGPFDIAGRGFIEFTPQWWMLFPNKPSSRGIHELSMTVISAVGPSSSYTLRVNDGRPGNPSASQRWSIEVLDAHECSLMFAIGGQS